MNAAAKKAPLLSVVPNLPNADVIDALEQLLAGARSGEVNGIAFVCTLPGMRYITDVAGFCYTHPTFARGAASYLTDQLAGLIHKRDPDGIR
ncbi:MAG: hypothetical protein EON54_22145 [Alcaligenaceae bacterium]|nr:MAG: hypothetical protein EON54_22145 [Alcaligenaceae bacterium]